MSEKDGLSKPIMILDPLGHSEFMRGWSERSEDEEG